MKSKAHEPARKYWQRLIRQIGRHSMTREEAIKLDRNRWEECVVCNRCGVGGSNELCCNGIEAQYCPFCGHPLTEKAWAELERKIGVLQTKVNR